MEAARKAQTRRTRAPDAIKFEDETVTRHYPDQSEVSNGGPRTSARSSAAVAYPFLHNARCGPADAGFLRALSIRQPYAELILRGTKRIEYLTWRTTIIGERFHIYAAQKPDPEQDDDPTTEARRIWSNDLAVPRSARRGGSARDGEPPRWMLELTARLISKDLPTGMIVGSAVIEKVIEGDEFFEWH